MIPSVVSFEIQEALRDFLATEFRPSNSEMSDLIDRFLSDDSNLIKGPYLSLALPFQRSTEKGEPFPEIPLGFNPYQHQHAAFKRLKSGCSSIMATGTGSGKTEAFLYPILDWCRQQSGQPGIKAILIYPMNALANDQASRIARIIHGNPSLRGHVVAGLYVGKNTHSHCGNSMTSQRIISNRETLLHHPPDILLTNYKMLDYLLSRPRDQRLWQKNKPPTLRWIVVDELHTFDGAQGTDLACLIRRLKSRLDVDADNLVCVGTSATLGSHPIESPSRSPDSSVKLIASDDQDVDLIEYAEQIFGASFGPESIIREQRLSVDDFLGHALLSHHLLPHNDLSKFTDLSSFASSEDYIRAQYELFFGEEPGPNFLTDQWRLELAGSLRCHSAFVNLLRTVGDSPKSMTNIVSEFRRSAPWCSELEINAVLRGLCALISAARLRENDQPKARLRPFLQVSFHLWVRELGRMVASLSEMPPVMDPEQIAAPEAPMFTRDDATKSTGKKPDDSANSSLKSQPDSGRDTVNSYRRLRYSDDLGSAEPAIHLPLIQCNQCRVTGWGAVLNSANDRVLQDLRLFYNHFFDRDVAARFIFPGYPPVNSSAQTAWVCGACGHFRLGRPPKVCSECDSARVVGVCLSDLTRERVLGSGTKRHQRVERSTDCPYCGSEESLFILGARSSVLLAVVLSQAYASRHNDDRKVIAFSDNVQDAAHLAGFLSHRTWRHSKRTAIMQAVPSDQGVSLLDLPKRVVSQWGDTQQSGSAFPPERFVGEFVAPDRAWMNPVEAFRETGKVGNHLFDIVAQRLEWEAVAEFGFSSAITRSLERTCAAAVGPDLARLKTATSEATLGIREEIEQLSEIDERSVLWMVLGVLRKMKDSGAIWSDNVDAIDRFVKNGFSRWVLNHNRALPEYGPRTPVPLFPCEGDVLTKKDGLKPLFKPGSPYQRWIAKVLHADHPLIGSDLTSAIIRIVLRCLRANSLVRCEILQSDTVWAIDPSSFAVSRKVLVLHGSSSTRPFVVPKQEAPLWVGAPCLDIAVQDRYRLGDRHGPTWAGRMYREAEIHRVVAEDHTALLSTEKREHIERRFATEEGRPSDPNALSATPTLELGIDIGNLSTVALCSVPPAPANYIQRIGRAGRRDGNSLTVTLAAAAPHDLYFYAQPLEMLGGSIDSPGVFLDASRVLERQLTSYCLDNWAADCNDPDAVPAKVRLLLDNVEADVKGGFPYPFLAYVAEHSERLFASFEFAFSGSLSEDSRKYLRSYLMGSLGKVPELRLRILGCLERVIKVRRSIKREIDRISTTERRLRRGPQDEATEEDRKQCLRERQGLRRLLREINGRDTFAFLTDEGLIPNYAFPEQGVTLHSIILRRSPANETSQARPARPSTDSGFEAYEYVRPSAAALSELAPGNHFYAEGRKVEIDRVDVDISQIEEWRLCPSCTHCQRIDDSAEQATCPRCGDPMWSDTGQARNMLPLQLVHATTADKSAQIMDDRDDREAVFFTRHLIAEFDPAGSREGFVVPPPDLPFAFEYAPRTKFREINFGRRTNRGQPTKFAGQEIPREGFRVCRVCGKVQPRKRNALAEHTLGCSKADRRAYAAIPSAFGPDADVHSNSQDGSIVDCLYLYRDFESESLRMLVPVIEEEMNGPRTQSFIAAVELGLKRQYRGKMDHIRAMTSFSIEPGSSFKRSYLVLYDSVPGGTGYLKGLAANQSVIKKVLDVAKKNLAQCECEDGCYRCLFAYRSSRDLQLISKRTAADLLDQILAVADKLELTSNIDEVSIDGLIESNLEARFVAALKKLASSDRNLRIRPDIVQGKSGYVVTVGQQTWLVEPQANLGPNNGVSVASCPDFLFKPVQPLKSQRSIAVFLDGFKYHKDSTDDDSVKRMALIRGGYLQWSLTWRDLEVAFGGVADAPDLLRSVPAVSAESNEMTDLQKELDARWSIGPLRARLRESSLELFLCYLEEPDIERWQRAVFSDIFRIFKRKRMGNRQFKQRYIAALEQMLPSQVVEEESHLPEPVFVASNGKKFGASTQYCDVFATVTGAAISGADPDGCFLSVHLHDQDFDDDGYRGEWNGVLRLFNLIQFLPHSWWTTTRAVQRGRYPEFEERVDQIAAIGSDWSDALELADNSLSALMRRLAHLKVPVPTVGFELTSPAGEVIGEAEIAWPEQCLAVLVDKIQPYAAEFQEAGWRVYDSGERAEVVASMLVHGTAKEG